MAIEVSVLLGETFIPSSTSFGLEGDFFWGGKILPGNLETLHEVVYLFLRLALVCLILAYLRIEILGRAGILKLFFSRNQMVIREVWIRTGDAVLSVFKALDLFKKFT